MGFLRYLDTWIYDKYQTTFSAKGVVLVNAAGGNKMYSYAIGLKKLGYDTCVFADNDNAKELEYGIKTAIEDGQLKCFYVKKDIVLSDSL